jgi:hypothetical protein
MLISIMRSAKKKTQQSQCTGGQQLQLHLNRNGLNFFQTTISS